MFPSRWAHDESPKTDASAELSTFDYYPDRDLLVHPIRKDGLTGTVVDGAPLRQVLGAIAEPGRSAFADAVVGLASGGLDSAVVQVQLQQPEYRGQWVEIVMQVIRPSGSVDACRILGTSRDITAFKSTRAEIMRAEERLTRVCRIARSGSFELDYGAGTVRWSSELLELMEAAASTPLLQRVAARDMEVWLPSCVAEAVQATHDDGVSRQVEYKLTVDGKARWFEAFIDPFVTGPGRIAVRGIVRDVSDQHEADRVMQLQRQLLDLVDVSVVTTDPQHRITSWNAGAERLHGWRADEMLGRPIQSVVADGGVAADEIETALRDDGVWTGEVMAKTKADCPIPVHVRHTVLRDAAGRPLGFGAIGADISERVRHARELHASADRLRTIADSVGDGLITLDELGRLGYMNPAAEELLGWRCADLIGREFHAVVHPGHAGNARTGCQLTPALDGDARGRRVVRAPDETFVRRDGSDLPVAVTAAEFQTDNGERGSVLVFRDNSERRAAELQWQTQMEQLTWAGRLRGALQDDRFTLYAQPIIDLRTGETVQHELLLRLIDEDGTVIAPGCFLPAAEEYGFMLEIDRWVAAQSVAIAAAGMPVEFNLSAQSLSARGVIADFEQELQASGADPSLIVIEITETALISDAAAAQQFIERVKGLGCRVALDDFGTGYGGFSYLKRLPIDYLKIDREFVGDLSENDASRHVVKAIVNLAQGFGQRTIAEGVEDAKTLKLLRDLGVDYAQGFHLGRPAPLPTETR